MKNYTIKDIVENDLCIGCGVCISESDDSSMIWNKYGFLVPDISKSFKEDAIKICPFNPNPEQEVQDEDSLAELFLPDTPFKDSKIGNYFQIYVGYSSVFRKTSSSGGIGTYISEQLLKQKIVDHLFVVKESEGRYTYRWVSEAEQLKETSKTRYFPVSMEKLFLEIDKRPGKVAVSGIPPFLKAIRLKQYYYPKYREKIPFLIGIICGGWKSSFFTDYLAQKSGIEGNYMNPQYRIKDEESFALDYSFGAFDETEQFHQMKMREAGDMWGTGLFNSNASDFSDDVTAELGDISLGDAWIRPYMTDGRGTSLFVNRSIIAEKLIKQGIANGELHLEILSPEKFILSQSGAFRHRREGLKFRIDELRKKKSIVPYKRKRILKNAPFEYKVVLKQRRLTRKKSFEIWMQTKNSEKFDLEVLKYKETLNKKTHRYYFVQAVRMKLGMKTI